MGGCYSAYACSRKLRGRLSSVSLVLPVSDHDHDAASGRGGGEKEDAGGDGVAAAVGTKTTAAEFERRYVLGRELGRGEFGVTRRCRDSATGEALACKTIRRHRRRAARRAGEGGGAAAHAEDVRREVAIMRRMSSSSRGGGAAVVRLREACEDADGAVHLVMELCEGGELFDRIVARGHYSERAAAGIFRTIVGVVQLCHSKGVMHRDLKPENFLFADKSEESPLKVIDFGLSVFFNPGGRERVLHGAGGAEAELRTGGGRVERRRDPLHPPLRRAPLLGRQRREDRPGDPPRRHRLRPGAMAARLRQRQGPRPPHARPRPLHPPDCHPSARASMAEERGGGAERVARGGGEGEAAAVLGHEQAEEEGAGGGGAEPAGGGAGQVRADVPPHGQGQERQPVSGGAHGGAPHQRPAGAGAGDQDASGSRGHGRERDAGLRRVRDGVAAPEEDDQRRVPGGGVQILRQGRQRLHRAGRAEGGAGPQRAGHPRDHPRRRHRPGRAHQLPGVRADDEVRDGLEERVARLLESQLQQPQPEALQGSLGVTRTMAPHSHQLRRVIGRVKSRREQQHHSHSSHSHSHSHWVH